MEKPDEKHVQGLWVIVTPTNIFTTPIYKFIFSNIKTVTSSSWLPKVRKGAKSIHASAPDSLGKERKTRGKKKNNSLVKAWERHKEMTLVDPQRRNMILAYRLWNRRIWTLEGRPASVKETFNLNHSVDSKKEGAKAAGSLLYGYSHNYLWRRKLRQKKGDWAALTFDV